MFVQIILLAVIASGCWIWLNSRSRRNLPPGPSPILPIIGNIPHLVKYQNLPTYETFDKLVDEYGPVVFIQFGKISQVIIKDLQMSKDILCSEVWVDRFFDDLIAERSYGKLLGIIFSFGDVWKEMRRFTTRTLRDFGFGKQKSMETVIEEEINAITTRLDKSAYNKIPLSMKQFFTVSILNVLWAMVAGVRFDHDDDRLLELIRLVDETSKANPVRASIVQAIPGLWRFFKNSPNVKRRRIFLSKLQAFFVEILNERRESGSYKGEPKDFIDVFLQEIDAQKQKGAEPNFYTDEQFIIVCLDLFVAGAETTSNTLEFAMLYMILNPRVQSKVQAEIDAVVGRSRLPSLLDRPKMPYTEATILEVQRMANVLPVIMRGCKEDTIVAGYNIPKGSLAGLNIRSLHLNKETWGDPMNFRPERFLDADSNIINAHKLLPFGLGKRVCLGEVLAKASLFSYFSSLLQRYAFTASPNHPKPSTDPVYGFTLSPEEYHVNLKQR